MSTKSAAVITTPEPPSIKAFAKRFDNENHGDNGAVLMVFVAINNIAISPVVLNTTTEIALRGDFNSKKAV